MLGVCSVSEIVSGFDMHAMSAVSGLGDNALGTYSDDSTRASPHMTLIARAQ